MKRITIIELFKLRKLNNFLIIALLFLYPIMWSVLAYRGEVVLVVNGHSMISWILACLFILEKPFIIMFVFILIGNEIIMKERKEGYLSMIENRALKNKQVYFGKIGALVIYYSILFLGVIIVSGFCYLVFVKRNEIIATGVLWNKDELMPGIACIAVYLIDKCVLVPIFLVALGRRYSLVKTAVILVILNLVGRILGVFPTIAQFSIWNINKKAESFVMLCESNANIVPASIILTFCICIVIGLIFTVRSGRKR